MTDWLNVIGNIYAHYTYDADPRLVRILETYPFAFDDNYWYWHPKRRPDIVKRMPLWTYPQKSIPKEKPRDPFQKKLMGPKKVNNRRE